MQKSLKINHYSLLLFSLLSLPFFAGSVHAQSYWSANGNDIYNNNSDQVGIGTTSPTYPLHLFGGGQMLDIESNTTYAAMRIDSASNTAAQIYFLENGTKEYDLYWSGADNYFAFRNTQEHIDMVIDNSGDIGIGTTSPGRKLDILDDQKMLRLKSNSDYAALEIDAANTYSPAVYFTENGTGKFNIYWDGTNEYFGLRENGEAPDIVIDNHNVGIGMNSGINAALHVKDVSAGGRAIQLGTEVYLTEINQDGILGVFADDEPDEGKIKFGDEGPIVGSKDGPGNEHFRVGGTLIAEEIIVQSDAWADYVFDDDYYLTPLGELEQYINDNGHLPDVPSTEEVTENGINVEEMNKILLQKIEELTLYSIDLQKQTEELKARVNKLENVCR